VIESASVAVWKIARWFGSATGSRLVDSLVCGGDILLRSLVCGTLPHQVTPRKGRRQLVVLSDRRTRLKNFSPFPLAALVPLELTGTNQGEPDTPDKSKGVHQ
jgi:hypothetical protein